MGLTRPRAYQIFDIDYKQSVRVVTVSNVTLSGGAPSTVDGVALSLNDRVLVTGQSTGSQNGLYYVTTVGTGSNGTWARSVDGNETGEIDAGMIVMVTDGTVWADTSWKLTTNDPITIGTTDLVFEQNTGDAFGNIYANGTAILANTASGSLTLSAGNNISITGNNTSKTITIESTAGGGTPGGANTEVQFNDGGVFGGSAGLTFNKTTNAVATTGTLSATGNITGGNLITSGNVSGNVVIGNSIQTNNFTVSDSLSIGNQIIYAQGSDGFSVNEDFNAGNATVTAYHYTSGAGRNAIVFDTAVTGQFTSGFGATGNAASNKFVFFAEFGNTFWEWRKSVGISAPNLNGGTLLANISADGNLWTAGTITGTGNISGGNIITAGLISATGNITGGNLKTSSIVIGGTTITGATSVTSTTFVGALTGAATSATTAGTVTTAAQPNITSVGTLGSLAVTGNTTSGNFVGTLNGSGANVTSISATNISSGTLAQARLANSSVTLGSTALTLGSTVTTVAGLTSVTSTTFVGALTGAATSATTAGTVTTAAQPNITSVGTLSSLAVTGNTTSGNFVGTLNGSGANVTSISATNISSGTLAQARLANSTLTLGSTTLTLGATTTTVTGLTSVTSTTFVGALTGAATTAGTVTTAAQPNITSVGTLSSLNVTANVTGGNLVTAGRVVATGNITGGNIVTSGSGGNITGANVISATTISTTQILNGGSNATGNIGNSTTYFNTAFVKATSAQYADLAEMYVADAAYAPGTVVEFGGAHEITQTTSACSSAVAGIISTNPSYLMNSCQEGNFVLPVALTGRVPCRVQGPVKKGDVLISSNIPGTAQRIGANWQPGCTVGKAMENIAEAVVKTIEVAVGRL